MAGGARLAPEQYALMHAVQDCDAKAVKAALDAGVPDINDIVDEAGKSLLQQAVEMEHGEPLITVALLEAGADPNKASPFGTTPLHVAAQQGLSKKVYPLLRHGANMNAQDMGGETPLHKAVGYSRRDIALELMQMGADTTVGDNENKPPYEMKRQAPDNELITRMIANKVPEVLSAQSDVSRAMLLERKDNGTCPLDAGVNWLRAGDWLKKLEAKGESLTKEDLLETGRDGMAFLTRALLNRSGEEVLGHMMHHGSYLKAEDVFDDKGQPNALLEQLTQRGLVAALFEPEGWKGHSADELSATFRALPDEAKQQVGNIHTLRAQLGSPQAQQARGR